MHWAGPVGDDYFPAVLHCKTPLDVLKHVSLSTGDFFCHLHKLSTGRFIKAGKYTLVGPDAAAAATIALNRCYGAVITLNGGLWPSWRNIAEFLMTSPFFSWQQLIHVDDVDVGLRVCRSIFSLRN